jgi:hypothetical protein
MNDDKPLSGEHRVEIAVGIVLSLLTCGLYNVYWNYREMEAVNALLGRREFDFVHWLLLTLVTCGLYHIYYEYRMGSEIQGWLTEHGRPVSPNLALMGLLLSVFGLTVIADAVYQHELNKLIA